MTQNELKHRTEQLTKELIRQIVREEVGRLRYLAVIRSAEQEMGEREASLLAESARRHPTR